MCRSRRELSNEYLLEKIGVDTTENEPLDVWGKIIQYYSFVSLVERLLAILALPPQGVDEARRDAQETRMNSRHLARAGDQHARFTVLREAANVQRSQHVCLDRLDRIAPEISSTGHSE